jgi:hypothetical protein
MQTLSSKLMQAQASNSPSCIVHWQRQVYAQPELSCCCFELLLSDVQVYVCHFGPWEAHFNYHVSAVLAAWGLASHA